jgi:hypothetical protein
VHHITYRRPPRTPIAHPQPRVRQPPIGLLRAEHRVIRPVTCTEFWGAKRDMPGTITRGTRYTLLRSALTPGPEGPLGHSSSAIPTRHSAIERFRTRRLIANFSPSPTLGSQPFNDTRSGTSCTEIFTVSTLIVTLSIHVFIF